MDKTQKMNRWLKSAEKQISIIRTEQDEAIKKITADIWEGRLDNAKDKLKLFFPKLEPKDSEDPQMTVKDLKQFIQDLPDDLIIYISKDKELIKASGMITTDHNMILKDDN